MAHTEQYKHYSASIVDEVERVGSLGAGPLTKLKTIASFLTQENIVYTAKKVHAKYILCHPMNPAVWG